jgi:hypothetical protein
LPGRSLAALRDTSLLLDETDHALEILEIEAFILTNMVNRAAPDGPSALSILGFNPYPYDEGV